MSPIALRHEKPADAMGLTLAKMFALNVWLFRPPAVVLISGYLCRVATAVGGLIFAVGQITGDMVTSWTGTIVVALGVLASFFLRLRREAKELSREEYRLDQEVKREQWLKDMELRGKIAETETLKKEVNQLKDEIVKLQEANHAGHVRPGTEPKAESQDDATSNS